MLCLKNGVIKPIVLFFIIFKIYLENDIILVLINIMKGEGHYKFIKLI